MNLTIPFTGLKKQYATLRTEILDVTDQVLRSGDLMDGNYTAEFESWLAKKNGVKYAVTCHSGTNALEMIAEYYVEQKFWPCPPRVLIPAMTYPATINAFTRAGWEVVIADTDYHGLMDLRKINPQLSVQALVAVGLYGHALDTHAWLDNKNGAMIMEDAAQHWLSNDCRRISSATAISFDPMKNLNNYGNGGAVVTDDVALLERVRTCRNNGKPAHIDSGSNSRMSEIDCAQMLIKAVHINAWQQRRSSISAYWIQRLKGTRARTLIDEKNHKHHAHHKFVLELSQRDDLQRNLSLHGIETKTHYKKPLHELPAYQHLSGPDLLSTASALSRRVLSLPIYPELTDLEVEYIIDTVLRNI